MTPDVIVFLLIGVVLGIHYGLDGFIGSTHLREFKDSPRLKNFRWVVGIGLITFTADLKALGIEGGNKKYDVLAYTLGFLIASAITIGSFAISIFQQCRSFRRRDPDRYPDQPYAPVLDYLMYGYQYYTGQLDQRIQEKTLSRKEEEGTVRKRFLPVFAKQISYSMAAVHSLGNSPSRKDLETTMIQLLKIIKGIALEYHHEEKPDPDSINVNVMVAYERAKLPPDLFNKVRFLHGNSTRYTHYLAITAYAEEDGKEDFVLPVEDPSELASVIQRSLPGAPLAFLRKSMEVIDATREIEYAKGIPPNLKKELTAYFRTKKFRSFGCVTITGPGAVQLGILVIESDKKYVFGKSARSKTELNQLLQPFALSMASLILARDMLRSTTQI